MIIHSPIISGSLTFADGSTFTLPDGGNYSGSFSGSIQISEVQSHLIPDTAVAYDLGSEAFPFRDLYLSTASIWFGDKGKMSFGSTSTGFSISDDEGIAVPFVASKLSLAPANFEPISFTSFGGGFSVVNTLTSEPAPAQFSKFTLKQTSASSGSVAIPSNGGVSFLNVGESQCTYYFVDNVSLSENLNISYTDCNGQPQTASINANTNNHEVQAQEGSIVRTGGSDNYRIKLDRYVGAEASPIEVAKLTVTGSAGGGTIVSTDSGIKITTPEDETQPKELQTSGLTLTNDSGVAGTKVTANAGTGQVSFTDLFDNSVGIVAEQVTIPPASGSSSTTTTVIRQKETADGGGVSFFEVGSSQCARYRIINHSTQQNLFFNYTDCDGNPVSSAQILTSTSDIVTMQMGSFQRTGGGSDHYDIKLLDYVNADYAVAEIKQLEISTTGSSDNIVIRLDNDVVDGTPKLILNVSGSDDPAELQTGNIIVSGSNGTSTITNDLPGEGLAVTDATGSLTPVKAKTFELEDPDSGDIITLSVSSGSLNTTATNSSGSTIANPKSNLSGSFTGSFGLTGDITSEADCVKIGTELNPICDIYATRITGSLSGTVNGINIVDVKANVDAILSGSAADKDSFAEIVSLINSVDTTNDSVFAGFVTSSNAAQGVQDGRLTALEAASGSIISDLSSHEGRTDNPHSVTATQVGLGNVDNTSDTNKPVSTAQQTALDAKLNINDDGVISGSSQVDIINTSGFTVFSGSLKATDDSLTNRIGELESFSSSLDAGFVTEAELTSLSSSIKFTTDFHDGRLDDLESFSSSLDAGFVTEGELSNLSGSINSTINALTTSDIGEGSNLYYTDTRVKTKLDADGVISGSSQITITESQISDLVHYTDSDVKLKLDADGVISGSSQISYVGLSNIPSGIVSGSSQIDITATTNYSTVSSHISSTSNPHSVTATQVGLGNVTNESKTTMFNNSTLTGTTTVDSISFDSGSITTDSGDLGIVAQGGISLVTSGGGDGVLIDANGNTTIYGALALESIPLSSASTNILVAGAGNVVSYRTLGSNAFTSDTYALDSALTTEKNRIDAILTGSQADKDSFAEIVTLINSVDTSNDSAFAGFVTSSNAAQSVQDGRLDALEIETGSLSTSISNHIADTNNPHSVTKAQVGLGNVENTALSTYTGNGGALDNQYITNGAGYTTYTSNQATDTTSNVTFGTVSATGDVIAYASSDKRLKDNIVNIENPIEKVQKLNGVTWDWNSNADELQQSLPNVGVIAQEVEEVFPQLVHDRENGYKGVDYAKLTGLLIEAVKEQQKQIEELKSKLG